MKEISIIIKSDVVYDEQFQFNHDINIETADNGKRLKLAKDDVDIYGIKIKMHNALANIVRIIKKEIDGLKILNEYGQTASLKTSQCGAELIIDVPCAYFKVNKTSDYLYQIQVETKVPIVEESER